MTILLNCYIFAFFTFFCARRTVHTLRHEELHKLDPPMRAILAREMPELGLERTPIRINPATTRDDGTHVYSAIIHTSFPDTLRSLDIQINTVLPGLITARLTAWQIFTCAKLECVNRIEAGEIKKLTE